MFCEWSRVDVEFTKTHRTFSFNCLHSKNENVLVCSVNLNDLYIGLELEEHDTTKYRAYHKSNRSK